MAENIVPHKHAITRDEREKNLGYRPLLIWFVGLSGSGKSTIASALEERLFADGIKTYILDGDNIRNGLNQDLDFSDVSRKENLRRISEVAKLFVDSATVVLTAFITPFSVEREKIKSMIGEDYFEVFVSCPLEECERRDVKGLYAKARRGEIKNFTGIDSPFEEPTNSDIVIESDKVALEEGVEQIYKLVKDKIQLNE